MCAFEVARALGEDRKHNPRIRLGFALAFTGVNMFLFQILRILEWGIWPIFLTIVMAAITMIVAYVCVIGCIIIKRRDIEIWMSIKKMMLAIVYPTLLITFMYILNHIPGFGTNINSDLGFVLLALAFITVMATDTFAMVLGRLISGPKLCPKISPNKSVSGAVCGFVLGTGFGIAAYWVLWAIPYFGKHIQDMGILWWHVLIIAAIASIFAQLGDILESFMKRKMGIKDMGALMPGHGGMMDRIDGLVVGCVVFAISFMIILL